MTPAKPHTADVGDWVLFAGIRGHSTTVLGGPWRVGKLVRNLGDGWLLRQIDNTDTLKLLDEKAVYNSRIKRIFVSRGEALLLLRDLEKTEAEFIAQRDALQPRYQARIDGLLLND